MPVFEMIPAKPIAQMTRIVVEFTELTPPLFKSLVISFENSILMPLIVTLKPVITEIKPFLKLKS